MINLIEPNIHPVLVHFAYALTVTSAVFYALSQIWRKEALSQMADWLLALSVAFVALTVAAGFLAYYTVAHDGPSHIAMTTHKNWAIGSAAFLFGIAIWRWLKRKGTPSVLFAGTMVIGAILFSVTAWHGGKVVYKHGIGVQSLPTVTGDGHDHDHGDTSHDDTDEHSHSGSDAHHDETPAPVDLSDTDLATPSGVIYAFHFAMSQGDSETVKKLMASDVVVSEGGGAERSFDEYASHHMLSDMAFTQAVSITTKDQKVIEAGDMATVITESQIHGSYNGQTIHRAMMETMTLKRSEQGWEIVHIHWSSAPITGEHEH